MTVAPGSVFKTLSAIAVLESGLIAVAQFAASFERHAATSLPRSVVVAMARPGGASA